MEKICFAISIILIYNIEIEESCKKSMKKIAFIFPNFFFIGAQRAAAAAARQLQLNGYEVCIYVVDPQGAMKNEFHSEIPIVAFKGNHWASKIPFLRIFTWPFELRRILKSNKPDILISICPQTNFTIVLYRIFFGKDVVFIGEEHQHLSNAIKNDPGDFKKPWKYFYYFSLKNYYRLDALRCVSRSAAEDFVQNWGIPRNIVRTIYPAFDLERIKSRSHGIQRNNAVPVICSVGRLTSQKNFGLLIRAFAYVSKQSDAVLKIAGIGPEKEALEALIIELRLQHKVSLLGFIEFAEELIASSDVFVMTSVWEGFPATLVESMVLGTPVISVNCESGPAELIEHRKSGILVDQHDARVIGEAILSMLNDESGRFQMSRVAQERVQKFSLVATVTELENLAKSLAR